MSFKRALLVLFMLCVGCAGLKEAVAPKATAYTLMVKPWHRYGLLKEDPTSILASVDAVFLSCQLQKSMVEYQKEAGTLTEIEAEEKLKEVSRNCRAHYTFLVALYTKKSSWNNLSDDNPFFRVFLEAEGTRRPPESVKEVKLKDDEISTFYPFVEPWMKVYLVKFGRAGLENAKEITLEFASLLGRIDLTWRLR